MDRYKSWVSTFIMFHITYLHDMTPNYYMHLCLGSNHSCYSWCAQCQEAVL